VTDFATQFNLSTPSEIFQSDIGNAFVLAQWKITVSKK